MAINPRRLLVGIFFFVFANYAASENIYRQNCKNYNTLHDIVIFWLS